MISGTADRLFSKWLSETIPFQRCSTISPAPRRSAARQLISKSLYPSEKSPSVNLSPTVYSQWTVGMESPSAAVSDTTSSSLSYHVS